MSTSAAAPTATYLYCLLRHPEPPDLTGVPTGLPGAAPPRLLTTDQGWWLVVADVPLPDYAAESLEGQLQDLEWVSTRAVAHESVVESFLGVEALVPMKLFTLFTSDSQALAHLRQHQSRLERLLDRVSGHREWGVRVRRVAENGPGPVAASPPAASGREFLLRKRERRQAVQAAAEAAGECVRGTWEELERAASEARLRPPAAPEIAAHMLLEASFLVPESGAVAFEAVVARLAARLSQVRCELTLTGPWPPYSFVSEGE